MKIETQQRIARNLKIIRVSNGLKQTQMAEYSGVSRAVYLSYENGELYDDGLVKLINNYKDLSSFAKGMLIERSECLKDWDRMREDQRKRLEEKRRKK